MSRPTRARGLKQTVWASSDEILESRPTRARGLKQLVGLRWVDTPSRAPRGRVD